MTADVPSQPREAGFAKAEVPPWGEELATL